MSKASKWIIGILAVALIIVSFLLWKSTGNTDRLEADAAARARTNDSMKLASVARDSADRIRDSIVYVHDSLQNHWKDSVMHLMAVQKDSLKSVKSTLQKAVADLGQAVASLKDSSVQAKYDSVKNTLDQIFAIGGAYMNTSDTTIHKLITEGLYKDSLNNQLKIEITDLKQSLTACTLNFDGLKKDFDKEAAKVKSQSLLAKIEIGIATGVGIFIGHILK